MENKLAELEERIQEIEKIQTRVSWVLVLIGGGIGFIFSKLF